MEDRYTVSKVSPYADHHVCAVFDGHSGEAIAQYCSTNIKAILRDKVDSVTTLGGLGGGGGIGGKKQQQQQQQQPEDDDVVSIVDALRSTFAHLDESAQRDMPDCSAGTTACAVYITPKTIMTINVGDSRAILYKQQTLDLSRDHKPNLREERDRIMRMGGFVTEPRREDGVHRVMGRLSLSRALGDWELRPWVSSTPDVTVYTRSPQDEFVLLATDGVWDVMSSVEVADMLKAQFDRGRRPQQALSAVLQECRVRGSGDNVTIVLADIGTRSGGGASLIKSRIL